MDDWVRQKTQGEGGHDRELNDRSLKQKEESRQREWQGEEGSDIYRQRQSLVSVSSGCTKAHLSVFSNQR